ncbi:hypothetical protein [Natronosalvus caseinilyticus]|uniref:hypothetical protein n=1 Tax=Natronosalvus caseinilyticus TaxID=2953747 RepID=UPI0028AB0425|nr:hypothetical protein [Natronosalvus caseinilyticus]
MADRTETIGVRVTPAEREKFESHVEESDEFESLSRFLRIAAHRHIVTDDQPEASIDSGEIVDAMEVALSDVSERLEELDNRLAEIDASVRSSDEIQSLTHEIISNLPTEDELVDAMNMEPMSSTSLEAARSLSTVGAWASYFEVPEDKTRRALARAQEFPDVKYIEGDYGYRRYYKTEDI